MPPGQRVCLGQRTVLIRTDQTQVHSRYLLYLLLTPYMRHQLSSHSDGSTVPHLNMSDIRSLSVPQLPSLSEQIAIADTLGALDDKIELNRRMNQTLEAMAQALFKSWFVDLDPVRAKAEGRPPAGMDAETAALFPDSFEDSVLGEIPRGWRIAKVSEVLELAYGKALRGSVRRAGSVPVYGSNGQIGYHDAPLVRGPGIVVGRKGNPGVVIWAHEDFFPIDTTFFVVPRDPSDGLHYLFHALRAMDLQSLGADSAVPGLNRNIAYLSDMLVPVPAVSHAFSRLVSMLADRNEMNEDENRTLAAIRDALLPKLLPGDIRVKEAETMAGAAL